MTKIYEGNHYILIHAGYSDPAEHRHMAAHILVTLHGKMKVCSGDLTVCCRGVMIPAGTYHRIDTQGNAALIFLFDGTSNISTQIKDITTISEETCRGIVQWYERITEEGKSKDNDIEYILWNDLGLSGCYSAVTDERILRAMAYIRSTTGEKLSCQNVADYVHLSAERFSHLFKQETGMTFASYVIYQRIMGVYRDVFQGKSITEASLQSGFSSSSHFADVNRRVFGLPMRTVMDEATFLRLS